MGTTNQGIAGSPGRPWPRIAYSAIPALLLAGYLSWGAQHLFGRNLSGFFYFGTRFAEARVAMIILLLALHAVSESPDRLGYAFLASLPLGTLAALAWCWESWRGWSLGV